MIDLGWLWKCALVRTCASFAAFSLVFCLMLSWAIRLDSRPPVRLVVRVCMDTVLVSIARGTYRGKDGE